MLLSAEHISKNYGTKQLLHDVSLYLDEGQKIGIIGVNGTGKRTLLKILAGVEEPEEGTLARHPGGDGQFGEAGVSDAGAVRLH